MNPEKNGKNHFLVGQEVNGSVVVSCIETKSPSGSRWLKIHREFVLKNRTKFWHEKLISREKGEETLADWLKEQAELKAKKEAAQAKAREMARKRIAARNGEELPPPPDPAKTVKTKLELPSKKHKPTAKTNNSRLNAATPASPANIKKPESLQSLNKSQELDAQNEKPSSATAAPTGTTGSIGGQASSTPRAPKSPKSPRRKQKPSSARTIVGEDDATDVVKLPKKPTSLRIKKSRHDDDVEDSPSKPTSLRTRKLRQSGDVQESPRKGPDGKVTPSPMMRDKNVRTRRESSLEATNEAEEIIEDAEKGGKCEKADRPPVEGRLDGGGTRLETTEKIREEVEEKARIEAAERAKQEAEKKVRLEAEVKARQQADERARLEAEEKARHEAEQEEKARLEAEETANEEALKTARLEAKEKATQQAEEKARLEAEERAKQEVERKVRLEAEEKARHKAHEKTRREAEERALQEAQENARLEAEDRAKQEADEKARLEAEEKARQEAQEDLRLKAEEKSLQEKARLESEEMKSLGQKIEENWQIEQTGQEPQGVASIPKNNRRKEQTKQESAKNAATERLGDTAQPIDQRSNSQGSANLIAEPPEDVHSNDAIVNKKAPALPYDEVLADSSSRIGHSDSDGDTKKKRRKKKESKSGKSDEKKRRKPKEKGLDELGNMGSETSGMDLSDSSKIDSQGRKPKAPTGTESSDWASAGSGMDLSDASKKKKKKKKKRDSKKYDKASVSHEDLERYESSPRNTDGKAKKKAKKKKKEKDEKSESTKTSRKKEKEAVVSNIHSQLEAMFDLPSEARSSGIEEAEQDSSIFQDVPIVDPDGDDESDDGSAEFHVDPAMLDHPLDDYSSDEPSWDSEDDFDYTRVAGINDFDNSGLGTNKILPAIRSSKFITDVAVDAGHGEDAEEAFPSELESKEIINFASLEELKDSSPTFAKIMGVWVERENKVLYRTPLETVERRSDGKKEVPVPTAPEAPSLGSMVRKWEAKFVKEESDRTEEAPRKLKNVWAEKLEFTKPFTKPSHKKSADEIKLIEDTVEKSFAFKDLTPDEMAPIVDAFERVEYDLGATIAEQGEPEGFYSIVQSGEVTFHSNGNKVGSAVAGDAFGELSLLYSAPLAAEVTATDHQTVLFQLDRTDFRHIMREQKIRSEEEKLKLLQSVDVFKNLDETDLRQLALAMVPHKFSRGDNLSSTFAEAPFCLVQQGSVSATDVPIGPGESFGEESLIGQENKRYEVKAMSDGMAFTIDRQSFEMVFGDFDRVSMKYRDKQALASIRQIRAAKLEEDQLDMLVRQITEVQFRPGTKIFELNAKMPPALYFVRSGKIKIVKKSGEERIITAGQYFGEEYMFFTSKQSKDVVPDYVVVKYSATAVERTVCGVLTLEEVGIVSGRIQAIQDIETTKNIALEDLERHRILGEGQFGVVWLVTVKNMEADPYALKVQYIDDPCRDDPADCIREEIKMMRSVQHPFIIQVINTYEDEETISMLLSLAPGGELFDILHRQDSNGWWVSGLAEPIAKFYAMVVADTLAFMHRQKYVYRDLKPENILIDKDGYPVLTDFGFVKKLEDGKTYTFCGTPNYVAPEVCMNSGHDTSADNWSLGVLMYELIDGANPFWEDGMDQQTLYELIVYGLHPPISRKKCSRAGRDLIGRLLEKDPSKRIGSFREKDILEHKWFQDFDIKELREKVIRAPWVPDKLQLVAQD